MGIKIMGGKFLRDTLVGDDSDALKIFEYLSVNHGMHLATGFFDVHLHFGKPPQQVESTKLPCSLTTLVKGTVSPPVVAIARARFKASLMAAWSLVSNVTHSEPLTPLAENLLPITTLEAATKLLQPTHGTSADSVYYVVALGRVNVSVRYKPTTTSIRVAPAKDFPIPTELHDVLSGLSFVKHSSDSGFYYSIHATTTPSEGPRVTAAIVGTLGEDFYAAVQNFKKVPTSS